jgi:hypothetical protein
MNRILTLSEAVSLASVIDSAIHGRKVARVRESAPDGVIYGTARSVGDENGNSARNKVDVRDCFLRVTTVGGWDEFWPMAELVSELPGGTFCADAR